MAKRQALRELQSRLALRLQAATTNEGSAAAWLAVHCADANYLFPLDQSGEIFPLADLQPVPYTQTWFLGVANLRGGLLAVVDLHAFANNTAPRPRSDTGRAESRLVALNAALDINCALAVDRLAGLRAHQAFAQVSAPAQDVPAYFGNIYTEQSGVAWQEINLQALSQDARFLNIAA